MLSHETTNGGGPHPDYKETRRQDCQRCQQNTWFGQNRVHPWRCIYCQKHDSFFESRLLLISGIGGQREMRFREQDGRGEHEDAALSTYAYPGLFLRIEYEQLLRTHDQRWCSGEEYDHEQTNIHLLDLPLSRLVSPDDFYSGEAGWHLLEEKLDDLYYIEVPPPCLRTGGSGYCQALDEWTPQSAYLIDDQGKALRLLFLLSDQQRRERLYTTLIWASRKQNNQLSRLDRRTLEGIIGILPPRDE